MRVEKRKSVTEKHPFHLVDPSPWPFWLSSGILMLATTLVGKLRGVEVEEVCKIGIVVVGMSIVGWLRDIVREGSLEGQHTSMVQRGLRQAVVLFIVSELMFFVAWFWAYFWCALAPSIMIGSKWPPEGITEVNKYSIPLLNTLILLTSGATITWAHHGLLMGKYEVSLKGLASTMGLSVWFMLLQAYEYRVTTFTISDSVYGSTFYMLTGFHGSHVLLGTLMIGVGLVRVMRDSVTRQHHVGVEASIWYWHFVDVVWLVVYISVYTWGSKA